MIHSSSKDLLLTHTSGPSSIVNGSLRPVGLVGGEDSMVVIAYFSLPQPFGLEQQGSSCQCPPIVGPWLDGVVLDLKLLISMSVLLNKLSPMSKIALALKLNRLRCVKLLLQRYSCEPDMNTRTLQSRKSSQTNHMVFKD